MSKKHFSFKDKAWREELTRAYSFRFTETPNFKECDDHIANEVNENHKEGFDNISLLTKDTYKVGAQATLKCSFEGLGCAEIILVKKPEVCEGGIIRYGECFEIVLWRGGINVWRHFMTEEHECSWHNLTRFKVPISEGEIHELSVRTEDKYIYFSAAGISGNVRVDDLFDEFYLGATVCEGIARLYDLTIED